MSQYETLVGKEAWWALAYTKIFLFPYFPGKIQERKTFQKFHSYLGFEVRGFDNLLLLYLPSRYKTAPGESTAFGQL